MKSAPPHKSSHRVCYKSQLYREEPLQLDQDQLKQKSQKIEAKMKKMNRAYKRLHVTHVKLDKKLSI